MSGGLCPHGQPGTINCPAVDQNLPELPERFLIPMTTISGWVSDVAAGRWVWTRNTRCKYVTMFFDTRAGAYSVKDRDGIEIDAETLLYQYKGES
jgi:ligand-binding sensor domain-containing protein